MDGSTRISRLEKAGREEETTMTECPVCGGEVPLESDIVVGELLECPDCGSELEVLETDPPKLGEAPETEEDWGE
jgi:alpha-aminoadipate carrier protein LysW